MQGLNAQEVILLVEYIKENNSWEHLHECISKGRKVPKYYTMTYDTRTNEMWKIEFYEVSGKGCDGNINTVYTFRTEQGYQLKNKIYEWLNEIT